MKTIPLKLISAITMALHLGHGLQVMAGVDMLPFPYGTSVFINRDVTPNTCVINSPSNREVVGSIGQSKNPSAWDRENNQELEVGLWAKEGITILGAELFHDSQRHTFDGNYPSIPPQALFSGRYALEVRIMDQANKQQKRVDLHFGDLRRPYDFVVKNCGWRSDLTVADAVPLEAPILYDSGGNEYHRFGGFDEYSLHIVPGLKACRLQLAGTYTLYSIGHGLEQPVLPWGPVYVYGFNREPITTISHTAFAAPPLGSLLDNALKSKEGPSDRVSAEINGMRFTLFGLREAIDTFKMR